MTSEMDFCAVQGGHTKVGKELPEQSSGKSTRSGEVGSFRNAGGWTLPWVSVREGKKEEGWGKSLRARLSLAYTVGTFSGSHWGLTCENTWLDLEFRKKAKVQVVFHRVLSFLSILCQPSKLKSRQRRETDSCPLLLRSVLLRKKHRDSCRQSSF